VTLILPTYPPPPASWDPSWARGLIEALHRAEIDRHNASTVRLAQGVGRDTGDVWTDGKPILRTVVPITRTFMEINNTAIPHGLTNVSSFVRMSGLWVYDHNAYPLPWTDGVISVSFAASPTHLYSNVWGSPTWTLFERGHVILDYTCT
jgi:hypothetical protein